MNPLASTTFSSGPKDKLAAVDVYDAGGGVVNSIQDKSTASSFDIGSLLSNAGKGALSAAGGVSGAANLAKVDQKTGSLSLNQDALFSRLNSSVPAVTSSIRDLSGSAKDSLTANFKDYGTVPVNFAGKVTEVSSSKIGELPSYSNYVNDVNLYSTNISSLTSPLGADGSLPSVCSVYDVDSHAALISTGVTQGSGLGLPNAFEALTKPESVGLNPQLITKVTAASLPILVKNGDLGNIKSMSATTGGQIFDAVLPSYGRTLTSSYSGPKNQGASVSDYQSFISIFTNTNSSWNVFDRLGDGDGKSGTLNLLKLLGGTREFQTLLAIGVKSLVEGDSSKHNILATMFGETTVEDQVHRAFPRVILQSDLTKKRTTKGQTIDPRVLSLLGTATTSLINT